MNLYKFNYKFRSLNECVGGKKIVHKVEPIFNHDTTKMRIFLEDGSLGEYVIRDSTTAEVKTKYFNYLLFHFSSRMV